MRKEEDIQTMLASLNHILFTCVANFEVWLFLKKETNRHRYSSIFESYNNFIVTSIHSHFLAFIVALNMLFENRGDTHNIPRLIFLLQNDSFINNRMIKELSEKHEKAKPILRKISILRNKVFAHRDKTLFVDEAFKQASLSATTIQSLIQITKEILDKLNSAFGTWDKYNDQITLSPKNDLERLFHNLESLNV